MLLNDPDNPHNCPFPLGFRYHAADEDGATAIGNMHRKIGKDRACGSGDMLADRQTDRQTHTQRRAHHNTWPPLPRAK